IPDKGTYWHLGKEVKQPVRGPTRPHEHPEINKPRPPRKKTKAELELEKEKKNLRAKQEKERREAGLPRIVGPTDDI
ncbi:unnamed protein product, partial [marine sediment metagenome]